MKIKVKESPFGDTGATYHGQLGMMSHYILQLKSYLPQWADDPAHTAWIEADIAGYQAIIDSNNEANALAFIEVKHRSRTNMGPKFKDNMKIVEYMKQNGMWK